MQGKLVVFEGIDGAGKSTQLQLLKEYLLTTPYAERVVTTKQPGGTEVGLKLRAILSDKDLSIEPMTELLFLVADRVECLKKIVIPSLEEGKIVLCDRWSMSSEAYQGYGRNLEIIADLHTITVPEVEPDLIILLTLPNIDTVKKRLKERSAGVEGTDRYEDDSELLQAAYEGYCDLNDSHSNIIQIDATQTIEEVHLRIREEVERLAM